jgi:hypothetical protein
VTLSDRAADLMPGVLSELAELILMGVEEPQALIHQPTSGSV